MGQDEEASKKESSSAKAKEDVNNILAGIVGFCFLIVGCKLDLGAISIIIGMTGMIIAWIIPDHKKLQLLGCSIATAVVVIAIGEYVQRSSSNNNVKKQHNEVTDVKPIGGEMERIGIVEDERLRQNVRYQEDCVKGCDERHRYMTAPKYYQGCLEDCYRRYPTR